MTTETRTSRPLIWHEESNALVPMTDDELTAAGWTRLPNSTYTR